MATTRPVQETDDAQTPVFRSNALADEIEALIQMEEELPTVDRRRGYSLNRLSRGVERVSDAQLGPIADSR